MRIPLSHSPVSDVVVWLVATALLVHLTLVPFGIDSVPGLNAKFTILTLAPIALGAVVPEACATTGAPSIIAAIRPVAMVRTIFVIHPPFASRRAGETVYVTRLDIRALDSPPALSHMLRTSESPGFSECLVALEPRTAAVLGRARRARATSGGEGDDVSVRTTR